MRLQRLESRRGRGSCGRGAVFATLEFQNLRTAAENVPGAKAYITTFSNFLGLQGEAPQHCIMAVVLAANHFDVPQSHLEACHSFVSELQHRVDFLFSSVGQPFDHALAVLDGASRFTHLLKSQNPNIAIHVVFYIACHNLSARGGGGLLGLGGMGWVWEGRRGARGCPVRGDWGGAGSYGGGGRMRGDLVGCRAGWGATCPQGKQW